MRHVTRLLVQPVEGQNEATESKFQRQQDGGIGDRSERNCPPSLRISVLRAAALQIQEIQLNDS